MTEWKRKAWYDPTPEEFQMSKVMKCRSVGLDCDFVARGENDDQVMKQVAEHARTDHGMQTIPAEVAAKVKANIHEE
jgi:predicted small metal-binding protein